MIILLHTDFERYILPGLLQFLEVCLVFLFWLFFWEGGSVGGTGGKLERGVKNTFSAISACACKCEC